MGVTQSGKVAVLTNYREPTSEAATGQQSRGAIVNSWLAKNNSRTATQPRDEEETAKNGAVEKDPTKAYVQEMVASPTARNVGGFSLVCGYVNEPLAIVSNRSSAMDQVSWIAGEAGQTVGLSNTVVDDRSWPKIMEGENLAEKAISAHAEQGKSEDVLIEALLDVLNTNSLPELGEDATAEDYLPHFRRSIFIPRIGTRKKSMTRTPAVAGEMAAPEPGQSSGVKFDGRGTDSAPAPVKKEVESGNDIIDQSYLHGPYGTQKQTVMLVQKDGRVRYFERTLYDHEAKAVPIGEGDRSFEFEVTR